MNSPLSLTGKDRILYSLGMTHQLSSVNMSNHQHPRFRRCPRRPDILNVNSCAHHEPAYIPGRHRTVENSYIDRGLLQAQLNTVSSSLRHS